MSGWLLVLMFVYRSERYYRLQLWRVKMYSDGRLHYGTNDFHVAFIMSTIPTDRHAWLYCFTSTFLLLGTTYFFYTVVMLLTRFAWEVFT